MFPVNEVVQGDCTRVLRQLPDSFVDLVVTDPPYGVRYQDSKGRTIANDDDPNRILGAFADLHRVLKPNSICISFYGWGQVDTFFRSWQPRWIPTGWPHRLGEGLRIAHTVSPLPSRTGVCAGEGVAEAAGAAD